MAMKDYFKGAVSAVAGAGMLAGAAFAPDTASAQDQQMAANDTARPQAASLQARPKGKHVILRVGPGFNILRADDVAHDVRTHGNCTAEVTTDKGLPGKLTVEILGERRASRFEPHEMGDASHIAKMRCAPS